MTLYAIQNELKLDPWARERRNRHDFIMKLLSDKYDSEYFSFDKRSLIKDFIDEYNTIVRYIQMAQKEDSGLRGKDYDDGKALAQRQTLELGYETGYNEFNKKVKNL